MKCRIALWASAGFLVAGGWVIYFAGISRDNRIEPIVSRLACVTCPIAVAGSRYPISLYWALVANVATYALVGLTVETVRRQFHHPK